MFLCPFFLSTVLHDGHGTGVVSGLHVWTSIRYTVGIYNARTQLHENEEAAFFCSRQSQRGLGVKQAPSNSRSDERRRAEYFRRCFNC